MTLRREAQLHPFYLYLLAVAVGLGAGFWFWGVGSGSSSQQDEDLRHSLEYLADSLKTVRATNDSLRHQDSSRSVTAAAARDSVAAHRPAINTASDVVDRAAAAIGLSQGETPAGDTLRMGDSTWVLPPLVATYVRVSIDYRSQTKLQLARYETALQKDAAAMATKDERIRTLERADSIAQRQDSTHRAREANLEKERSSAFKRGCKAGVKIAAGTALLISGAVKLVKVIAQ